LTKRKRKQKPNRFKKQFKKPAFFTAGFFCAIVEIYIKIW